MKSDKSQAFKAVQAEILAQKADTLSNYGRRVEVAIGMFHLEKSSIERSEMLLKKLDSRCEKAKKKRMILLYQKVEVRLHKRLEKSRKKSEELRKIIDKLIYETKAQREAIGLHHHELLEEHYEKMIKKED